MPATKISRKPLLHKDRAARAVRQILDSPSPAFQPPWSNANGWNYPQYFATMRLGDVDGDGKAELVGRGAAGAQIWWFDTVAATWISLCMNQCNWTDANGWGDVSRAETLRLADVNGDDVCELIARNQTGLEVWQYDPSSGSCRLLVANGCNWTDAAGWNQPQYYATILCADINGDGIAEILGRGANGIEVWSCANGSWAQLAAAGCNWTDAAGWNQPQYYSTILAADVNGDGLPELIGRGANGMEVWSFQNNDSWSQLAAGGCNWTDSAGWNQPQYYATIVAADVNGDGKAELIGRNTTGIEVWSFTSGAWSELTSAACGWTDAANWNQPQYYSTIRAADINGDGLAELTGRGASGLVSFLWQNNTWVPLGTDAGLLSDNNGWSDPSCYPTLLCGGINNSPSAALLGRSSQGVETLTFNPASGWQLAAPLLKVDARFSQNYLMESATPAYYNPGTSNIAAAVNAAGEVELFVSSSYGPIYNVYPDPTSDTGWSSVNTNLSGFNMSAAQTPSGGMALFSCWNGSVIKMAVRPAGPGAAWPAQSTSWIVDNPGRTFATFLNGTLSFAALTVELPAPPNTPYTLQQSVGAWSTGTSMPGLTTTTLPSLAWLDTACGALCVDEANQAVTYTVFYSDGSYTTTPLVGNSTANISPAPSSPVAQYAYSPLGALPNPWTQVFQLNGITVQLVLQGGILSSWLNAERVTPLNTQAQPLTAFTAAVNGVGDVEVFGVGQNNHILHARYLASYTWTPLVDLGQSLNTVTAAVDADGYAEVFGPTTTNSILHAWQDTPEAGAVDTDEAGTLDWQTEQVSVQTGGSIQPVSTYTTQITVLDSTGLPCPGSSVSITAASRILAIVNGAATWIDYDAAAVTQANDGGQVTIVTQTNSLSTPLLNVWTDQMPEGTSVVVEPNADVQAELSNITAQQLSEATDASGNPIVPASYQGQEQQLASVITQCMSLVAPEEESTSTPSPAARKSARLATRSAKISNRIDHTRVPAQHWRFKIGNGTVHFEPLTAESAAAAVTALRNPTGGITGGLFGLPDWGDIWESVRDVAGAITSTLEGIVTTVADGIQVAINFVSDTINYVWDGIVTFVEQAFDVVEGIFETIGATFQRVYEWLAFLFDWNDIINTKNAISWLVNESFAMLSGLLTSAQQGIDSNIASWQNSIASWAQDLASSVAGHANVLEAQASNAVTSGAVEKAQSHNVLMNALLDYGPSAAPPAGLTGPTAAPRNSITGDPVSDFLTNVENTISEIQQNPSFQGAFQSLTDAIGELSTNPLQALKDAIAAMIQLAAGIASSALSIVKLVADTILLAMQAMLSGFQTMLNANWNIPFLSALYTSVTTTSDNPQGSQLSALDLMCLAMAIPATVLYKAFTGDAPFTDLAAMQQQLTASSMLSRLGITDPDPSARPSTASLAPRDTAWVPVPASWIIGANCVFAVASIPLAYFSGSIDGTPPSPVTTPWDTIKSVINTVSEFIVAIAGSPVFSQTEPTFLSVFIWSWSSVSNVIDAIFLAAVFKQPELAGDIPVLLTCFLGCGTALFNLAAWIVDHRPFWLGAGQIIGSLPGIPKPVRIDAVYAEYPGGIVVLKWMDWICIPVGAVTAFAANMVGLLETPQDSPRPAPAFASYAIG